MDLQAQRLEALEQEMTTANEEYIQAVNRASAYSGPCASVHTTDSAAEGLYKRITEILRNMLNEVDADTDTG